MSRRPDPPLAPLPLLWRAFAATPVIAVAIGAFLRPDPPTPTAEPFSRFLVALAVPLTALSLFAPRVLVAEKAADPRARALARWGAAQAIGISGLAALAAGGSWWIGVGLGVWGLLLVGVAKPDPEEQA